MLSGFVPTFSGSLLGQYGGDELLGTVIGQFFGDGTAEGIGVFTRGLGFFSQDDGAVGMANQAVQGEQAVLLGAVGGQRYLAAAAQRAGECAFGGNSGGGLGVIQRGEQGQ